MSQRGAPFALVIDCLYCTKQFAERLATLGNIFPSGFIPLSAGDVRNDSLVDIYRNSEVFTSIRDSSLLQGKCGVCPFNVICGGSRSRTYAMTGDLTAADPTCRFQPPRESAKAS